MNSVEVITPDDFTGERTQLIGENHHVVAVPSHPPADVEQYLVEKRQHRRYLVGDDFGRMKMSRVQAEQRFLFESITQIELVRADNVAFRAYTEEFRLHRIEQVRFVHRLSENLIE